MNQNIINTVENIKSKIETKLDESGYKLINDHFENGFNLHSEQYYFAKRYFQNTDDCNKLVEILCSKLDEFNFPESTTLVGFRNYTSLLLNKTVNSLQKYNYAIIEQENNSFVWQYLPPLGKNLVIILPITCTCSTYIKLKKFLEDHLNDETEDTRQVVNTEFINIFLILEESLRSRESETIDINSLKKDNFDLYKIYSGFNWLQITKDQIIFKNKNTVTFVANPLIRLYAEMYLPELCPLCFPTDNNNSAEKPLFPTHDNFETPNLIFDFPNFSNASNKRDFFPVFASNDKIWNVHLYGNNLVNSSSYASYIRGNVFYEKNKESILKFFNEELLNHLTEKDEKVIFITTRNKHNSNFLEDISLKSALIDRSITILHFQPSNEFIDNFISLHSKSIKGRNVKVIYFEDVISAGRTFKLVSNYIKHSKNDAPKKTGRHGFDLVLTLLDRTLSYTKDEIIKKIYSDVNEKNPEDNFITFFKLNVPIISATHLGNPLTKRVEDLNKMIDQCHLDSLKITISKEIDENKPQSIPELTLKDQESKPLRYFPFQNLNKAIDKETFELYKPYFNEERLDLLKLYLAHKINTELSSKECQNPDFFKKYEYMPDEFIRDLIEKIKDKIGRKISNYFILPEDEDSPYRNKEIENEIVHDNIVKILSRHPFIYYKNVYEAIFHYCIIELDKLHQQIERDSIKSFVTFRKLKFYLRRSIELNSNFIVSERFIKCIREQFNKKSIDDITDRYKKILKKLEDEKDTLDETLYQIKKSHTEYKLEQVTSYFSQLLYYYKELIFRNPSKSIKLEELINSDSLLPEEIKNPDNPNSNLKDFISEPYFHLTGMIKAENIYLLSELKELHKENVKRQMKLKELNKESLEPQMKLKEEHIDPDFSKLKSIRRYYFRGQKNDPKILNAQKLIEKSRHYNDQNNYKNIIVAISQMLKTVGTLEIKKSNQADPDGLGKSDLNTEIKEILDSVIEIIQPGIERDKLDYAFFVKFRKRPLDDSGSENIYSFVSDEASSNPILIKLNKDGLIYNMIYGLYDDSEYKNQQTLIAAVKMDNGEFVSFKDKYFYKSVENNKRKIPFSELYKNDFFNPATEQGIDILTDANMSLIFRLSNLKKTDLSNDEYRLEGSAVLLITNKEEGTISKFLNFMSNEKVRLLLLIKEELLDYLQKQFDNDAFIEVLESKKNAFYQDGLRHGLVGYINSLERILSNIRLGYSKEEDFKIFQLITRAMRGQLLAAEVAQAKINEVSFSRKEILDIFRLMFSTPKLGHYSIDFETINIDNFNLEKLQINKFIFTIVALEIIINIKKYSPRFSEKELSIGYDGESRTIYFRNKIINTAYSKNSNNKKGGMHMCNEVLRKHKIGSIEKKEADGFFEIRLSFNNEVNYE